MSKACWPGRCRDNYLRPLFCRFANTVIAPAVTGEAEEEGRESAATTTPKVVTSQSPQANPSGQFVAPTTPEGWVQQMTPIVPGIGYTAPIFAKTLRVQSVPRTFCVVSGGDYRNTEQSRCTCYTEQGTKMAGVNQTQCRSLAVTGYYDPFRAPAVLAPGAASSTTTASPAAAGAVPYSVGTRTAPSAVGSPRQGDVWGVPPAPLRAGG